MRILAVDDDEIFLAMLEQVLGSLQYDQVTFAESGTEAVKLIETSIRPFDCFLLDIQMPEVDGIDLCNWIRKQPDYGTTPVIMITAMSDRKNVERAFAAGATDYITKPLDVLELSSRIRLAGRLRNADRRADESHGELKHLKNRYAEVLAINPAAPRLIQDIDGAIDLVAMENYLLQLSRIGSLKKTAVAFRLPNFGRIQAEFSALEFDHVLSDIAEAITDSFKQYNRFISYVGSGVFVCLVETAQISDPEDLEDSVRFTLKDMNLAYKNVDTSDFDIQMGMPVRFGLRTGSSAIATLYQAIDNATRRGPALSEKVSSKSVFGRLRNFSLAG